MLRDHHVRACDACFEKELSDRSPTYDVVWRVVDGVKQTNKKEDHATK